MHAGPELQRLDHLRAKEFQRATGIVHVHAADETNEPIRDHRWHIAREEVVLAITTPSAHDIVRARKVEQAGDVGWIVLKVAIEGDDELAARVGETSS